MKNIILALTATLLFATCKKEDKKQNQTAAESAPGFTIKYYGNHNTGGTVPFDGNYYNNGDTSTALANAGNLTRTGFTFRGWNTDSSGAGTDYCVLAPIAITNANIKLYARWGNGTTNPATMNSSFYCGGAGWISPTCSSSGSLTLKSTSGMTEVSLTFATIPGAGSYSVSTVSSPTNVLVTVQNAPGQPCGLVWRGKTGVVSVTTTSNSINATFNNIPCLQPTFLFPVVTVSGSIGCN